MRLLFVADGRSPIALNWINFFVRSGHEVHLASTFPCQPIHNLASLLIIPVAYSDIYDQVEARDANRGRLIRAVVPALWRTKIRQIVAPLSFPYAVSILQGMFEHIQPDLMHAMRIPYEGMIASLTMRRIIGVKKNFRRPPLLASVWGNDFTLHAKSTPLMSYHTRQALQRFDALHTDCQRDQHLAIEWGFNPTKPGIVLPGGGGIQIDLFYPAENGDDINELQSDMEHRPVTIINPRGYRAYVRNDTFFRAIRLVIDKYPEVNFICPDMSGEERARKWISEMRIGNHVDLLPAQSRQQMAELFRQAQISVSISTHDGTPNTLLEAFACGCFPIVGDIESLREWITPGVNGLVVDPSDPRALAAAILNAISKPKLRRQAREHNLRLVKERAEYGKIMSAAEEFYRRLISTYM